ncbi:MAG: universal stress protein [Candidatus Rokubacteria bacterium]|nr:universal stress protein [Candidatus Rokubacteria bacterium]
MHTASWSTQSSDEREGCAGLGIRHVLVPLDGSTLAECALPWAVAVAQALAARITLLRVLERPGISCATSHHHDAVDWEMQRAEAQSQLARIDRDLKARQLASVIELREGRPAEQILNFARAQQVDFVVLSSHGEGGLSGWALSSTALMVVARTHCSVLVVPAHAAEGQQVGQVRLRRVLLPLDCSPRAECVLPLATALARVHDVELILAHVAPEPEMPRRLPPSAEDLAVAGTLTERNRLEGERYLAELRDRLVEQRLRVGTRLVVSSRRERAIRAMADEADVDLVMVSAHGRTGDARDRYGSVAARLVEESSRPIIVLQDLGARHEPTPAEEATRSRPGH